MTYGPQSDSPSSLRHVVRVTRFAASVALCAALLAPIAGGCRDEDDPEAMVMQGQPQPNGPATRPSTRPSTQPADLAATRPAEDAPAPVFISIDGVPFEFPPAKLYLKRNGERVRALLLSDDPPEAVQRGYKGDSFYFEMDMEIPPAPAGADGQPPPAGPVDPAGVSPEDLASAEWVFNTRATAPSDSPSGVFLGGKSHLQPVRVSVWFEPLDERTVIVTLDGTFAEYDKGQPRETAAKREVRVQAVIPADAIRR